ncbi:cubilin homolog [Centruroides sculpturatus]|uniref:cubilin homolog n=1 Tax=Centruroides sculpturatus TaxID=218467 RepID=UPI000C6D2467|nr:cubilin homolog [Centruroides sculpturatus]
MIRDGGTMHSPVLGIYCGNYLPETVYATGNIIFVRYVTSGEHPHSGFSAEIHTAECGGLLYGRNISITSPNFPQNYSNSQTCEWNVYVWEWRILKYRFDVLDLADTSCNKDFVEVKEENSTGKLYLLIYKIYSFNIA